jgi:hypothetical protein
LIFEYVGNGLTSRSDVNFKILTPLSKKLQTVQRISLYRDIFVGDDLTLLQLYFKILELNVGGLVKKMTIMPYIRMGYDDRRGHVTAEANDKAYRAVLPGVLHQLSPLLPSLVKLVYTTQSSFSDQMLPNSFLDDISNFPLLQHLELAVDDPAHVNNLLKLKHLKVVRLTVFRSGSEAIRSMAEVEEGCERLVLDQLNIIDDDESLPCHPAILGFIGLVDAKSVDLSICPDALPALACIVNSPTVLCLGRCNDNLEESDSILDAQLNRFTKVEHLSLSGLNFHEGQNMYTNILTSLTSLQSITLEDYYRPDLQNLIEALAPATSAVRLKTIYLNNVVKDWFLGEEEEEDHGWYPGCTIHDVADLIKVTADRGIELVGSTLREREDLLKRLSAWGLTGSNRV